jgi:hypothetical protein
MRHAETAAGRIRPEQEPAETGYVQPGLLETALADALMRLGDTGPARQYAAEAVGIQAHARGRVHRLATLADCELRAGSVEGAVRTADRMLDTVQGMESHRLHDRLAGVRRSLTGTGSRSVRDVVGRIDDTLGIPLQAVWSTEECPRRKAAACQCGGTSASAPCTRTGGAR